MTSTRLLHDLLAESAARVPASPAVVEPGVGALTWSELDALSDRVRDRLHALGVRVGDRVGMYLPKTIDGIATVYGILKAGGAYVPVDPDAPPARCALIFSDCAVKVVVTEQRLTERLQTELETLASSPAILQLPKAGGGAGITAALDAADADDKARHAVTQRPAPEGLAYILYTSGSTGRPKGVMLSHRAGMSYVEWCTEVFAPTHHDRFSSHAPLHFDLSILDLYASAAHGAAVVLLGEKLGKDPLRLAEVIANERITVWYSTPSILSLLTQYGKLERHDHSSLRFVLFAGEVFPVPRLREVVERWPHPRYFNLYGPTETNVCTYYEVKPPVPEDRVDPYPIGRTCENLRSRVVDMDGSDVASGGEGELVINGDNVMDGYWNLPERNAAAFLVDGNGDRWYRTGDLVVLDANGDHVFHGRRDRMVKRRGYRIELGEIEAGLATHPLVREVAVVADHAPGADVRITAVLRVNGEKNPSTIELKQFCMERLPKYMVPDRFTFVAAMPRTSTDKIDYQSLLRPPAVTATT
ncbi:MAG: amino acid adenylation domain-containing protein [Gemmatimonas sp.]